MPRLVIALVTIAVLLGAVTRAQAGIIVTVDKSAQRLTVVVDGSPRFAWPVSTARWGYMTPNGSYRPERLERQWFSRKYDMSPMPHSIFFDGGYAIHGSYEISHLGRPASHGCIRLHPKNAAILFGLVQEHVRDTRIVVTGEAPASVMRGGEGARASRGFEARHSRISFEDRRSRVEAKRSRVSFEDIFSDGPGEPRPARRHRESMR